MGGGGGMRMGSVQCERRERRGGMGSVQCERKGGGMGSVQCERKGGGDGKCAV